MKLIHRIHANADAPWPRWVWDCEEGRAANGHHLTRLAALMPLYRCMSTCVVGDGCRTAFWMDSWIGGVPLGDRFPALFSHALKKDATVRQVLDRGVRATLVPRLNSAGEGQLPELMSLIAAVSLGAAGDTRVLSRCAKRTGALDAGALYKLCSWGGVNAPYHAFVWLNYAPSKVIFFAWLLSRARIQSRSELLKKKILIEEEVVCPICCSPCETANHVIFGCSFAQSFWAASNCRFPADADVRNMHAYTLPPSVPVAMASTYFLLCCWNMWKHRNAVVFRERPPSLPDLLRSCRDDAHLWRVRLPHSHESDADAWLSNLGQSDP